MAAGRIPRLVLLYGAESLLVEDLLARLAAAIFPDAAASAWNREVLYADAAPPEAVVAAGSALPLFGGRRLVVVRGAAELPAKAVERLRAAVDEARRSPGGWPAEDTTVALVAGGADRRAPARRLVPEDAQVEVPAPASRALPGWLRERGRATGLELTAEAAQVLVGLVGDDLGRLAGELEKASVYVSGDARISEDVVRALTGETRVRQYWELTQALEAGTRAEALRCLEQLLGAGDDPLVLLAWVVGYLRNLWRVVGALTESVEPSQLARILRPPRPEWVAERLMARAAALGSGGIAHAVERCFEVERALKTGGPSARSLLTLLVADLAR